MSQNSLVSSYGEGHRDTGFSNSITWFYLCTVAFGGGVLLRSFVVFNLPTITFLAMLALVVGVVACRRSFASPTRHLLLLSLLIFSFALGALRLEIASWNATNPVLEAQVGQKVVLEGVIRREPEARAKSIHLYIKTEYGLILATTELGGQWRYGGLVSVEGELRKPESFETDLGRTFDYAGYLLAKGVSYTIGFAKVEQIDTNQGSLLISSLLDFKLSFMNRLEQLIPEPQAGLGEGLLLGVKKALGEDLERTFRQTGIIHIVVLSGYNVMIVVSFILFVLGTIFGRRLSAVFGIVGIALFAILVGLGATVIRASLMASLLLFMGLTGRLYLVLRGLVLAGVLMLLWNPYSLAFDVGFQLSFLATLGLILVSPKLTSWLSAVPTIVGVREFLTATLATQLFVLPLLLYQIGEFSVVAVIVNVLVLPMVPVAMLLTFATGITAFFSLALATPIAYLAHLSLSYIIVMAEWFALLPFAAFTVPAFSFWFVPIGYAVIAWLLWLNTRELDELRGWQIVEEGI